MKVAFLHPAGHNGIITTSLGKIEAKTDSQGREGIIETDNEILIAILRSAKFQEVPIAENSEENQGEINEEKYNYHSPAFANKTLITSKGKVKFDKDGFTQVSKETANILIEADVTPTEETKQELIAKGVIKETPEVTKEQEDEKKQTEEETQSLDSEQDITIMKQEEIKEIEIQNIIEKESKEEEVNKEKKTQKEIKLQHLRETCDKSYQSAFSLAIKEGKDEEEAKAIAKQAELRTKQNYLSAIEDSLVIFNKGELMQLCVDLGKQIPEKRTKENLIKTIVME